MNLNGVINGMDGALRVTTASNLEDMGNSDQNSTNDPPETIIGFSALKMLA
ncbi:hypothetical protein PM082_012951 [Marasmius tenuissimus]|nr:hypothetical protein PM082_012951 [Marasmius tenuissimus]